MHDSDTRGVSSKSSANRLSWWDRALFSLSLLTVGLIVGGPNACQENYCLGCNASDPDATETAAATTGTPTETPTATFTEDDGLGGEGGDEGEGGEGGEGGNPSPEPTATLTPSPRPELSLLEALAEAGEKPSTGSKDEKGKKDSSDIPNEFEFSGRGQSDQSLPSDGTWLGKAFSDKESGEEESGAGEAAADDDPDGDGLTNAQEVACGTDPSNPDTDGDGYCDDQECLNGDGGTARNPGWAPSGQAPRCGGSPQ